VIEWSPVLVIPNAALSHSLSWLDYSCSSYHDHLLARTALLKHVCKVLFLWLSYLPFLWLDGGTTFGDATGFCTLVPPDARDTAGTAAGPGALWSPN
jgi:hypothetical protein